MSTATYIGTDATTRGDWLGAVGALGYHKLEGAGSDLVSDLPSGLTVMPTGFSGVFSFASGTTDGRDLQRAADANTRDADCWYVATSAYFDIDAADSVVRRLRIYLCDRTAAGQSSAVRVTAGGSDSPDLAGSDVVSGATLEAGVYLIFDIGGPVRVHCDAVAGSNVTAFGLFLDDPGAGGGPSPPASDHLFISTPAGTLAVAVET